MKMNKFLLIIGLCWLSNAVCMEAEPVATKRKLEAEAEYKEQEKKHKIKEEFKNHLEQQKEYYNADNCIYQRKVSTTFSKNDIQCYLGQQPQKKTVTNGTSTSVFDPNFAYIEKFIINGPFTVLLEKKFPIEGDETAINYNLRIAETKQSVQITHGIIELFRHDKSKKEAYTVKAFNVLTDGSKVVWLSRRNNDVRIYFAKVPSKYGEYIAVMDYKNFDSVAAVKIFQEDNKLGIMKKTEKIKFKDLPEGILEKKL